MSGNSIFFETFIGEVVEITTKLKIKIQAETEEGHVIQGDFVRIQGFLLDMDEQYYYLGESSESIDRAVKIKDVIAIVIAKSELDDILDSIETPDDKKGFN